MFHSDRIWHLLRLLQQPQLNEEKTKCFNKIPIWTGILNEYINHKNFKMGKSSPLKKGHRINHIETKSLAQHIWGFGVRVPNLFDWLYLSILRILAIKLWKIEIVNSSEKNFDFKRGINTMKKNSNFLFFYIYNNYCWFLAVKFVAIICIYSIVKNANNPTSIPTQQGPIFIPENSCNF